VKSWIVVGVVIAAVSLSACKRKDGTWASLSGEPHQGRYLGVGVYRPEAAWARMVSAQQTDTTPAAKTAGDQVVIVVVDSGTGEVRACGDLSGYCIGMNPWNKALAKTQIAPIAMTRHAKAPPPDDLDPAQAEPAKAH